MLSEGWTSNSLLDVRFYRKAMRACLASIQAQLASGTRPRTDRLLFRKTAEVSLYFAPSLASLFELKEKCCDANAFARRAFRNRACAHVEAFQLNFKVKRIKKRAQDLF